MKITKITTLLLLVMILVSCSKDTKIPLEIPEEYVSENYEENTQTEQEIRNQLTSLINYMKKGDNVANKLVLDSLKNYFESAGTTTLKSITPSYYSNLIENSWFPTMVESSQNSFDIADAPDAEIGGVFVDRLLDSKGLETLQLIDKGMYMATMYNYFVNLTNQSITQESIDKMICIFGAHSSFPNTNTASNTSNPDEFLALYTARRDRLANSTGLYRDIKNQFLKLQAAVIAGNEYQEEQKEAVASLKLLMEKSLMATVINYINSARIKIDKETVTNNDKTGAIHDLSECVGFIYGLKAVSEGNRKITDDQIDDILTFLKAPISGDKEIYLFATSPATSKIGLEEVRPYIKGIYNFSDTEMTDFNFNWVNTEGR